MRMHNGTILVTNPASIDTLVLDGTGGFLTQLSGVVPTGDAGQQLLQVTLRSTDRAFEWRFGATGGWFWMAGGDVLVLPVADRRQLDTLQVRRAANDTGVADLRVIFEN